MTDLDRYLQKAIGAALTTGTFKVYGQRPPGDANTTMPYCTVTVSKEPFPAKGCNLWRATSTVTLYDEYREYGGMKAINEASDAVVTAMVGDLSIDNFHLAGGFMLSSDSGIDRTGSVDIYRKVLRFQHLISE
jgi:hypothetical protein